MEINVHTKQRDYPIIIERGILAGAGELIYARLMPAGQIFMVTDSGVPECWQEQLAAGLGDPDIYVVPQGEASKCMKVYEELLTWLADRKASRKDMIVALGGGVVGDLAGFAAATYMRGISYVNVPTTALSQIDSSIGGKTAIDLGGLKNIVGAFHQPSMVIIDPDTLTTLPPRQLASGLAEAVKSGLIRDAELFRIFESDDCLEHIDEIIERSLLVKRAIVEEDENESSVRKLLNFGHSFGHAYETWNAGRYLHGECVAMGMMSVLQDEEIRSRLSAVLSRLGLPKSCDADPNGVLEIMTSDKKAAGGRIDIVQVDKIGQARIENCSIEELGSMLR